MDRKTKLKIACSAAGFSGIREFAHSIGVTDSCIHRVLKYPNLSKRVTKEIDSLIDEQFAKLPNLNQGGGGRKRAA